MSLDPQLLAASPNLSAGVRANAGTGKTWTLVGRVARLLLHRARPDTILCVTYTKAAAAEMQTRLFETLGKWSVLDDEGLRDELAKLDEAGSDLKEARKLFARALETPGGLKIQTLHAFCEKLLRRFPIEAGLSPGFTVLENAAQAKVAAASREALAHAALSDGSGDLGSAYAHMAVQLDERAFEAMLAGFSARRRPLGRYLQRVGVEGLARDVWRRCGFQAPVSAEEIEGEALAAFDPRVLERVALLLDQGGKTAGDMAGRARAMLAGLRGGTAQFDQAISLFCTKDGGALTFWERDKTMSRQPALQEAMLQARDVILGAREQLKAVAMATDTLAALTLGAVQVGLYEQEKAQRHALD
ncbi:MAG: ATP-dependent nuclease subunit, partial [Caulobacteraceae bacterium]|nr:ATP-dependent nuclease subunit [Caulobacteraceae bacterium]